MNTKTYTHRSITLAQSGFTGRRAKWRVAVATSPEPLWFAGQTKAGRAAIQARDLKIVYLRGTESDAYDASVRLGYCAA